MQKKKSQYRAVLISIV